MSATYHCKMRNRKIFNPFLSRNHATITAIIIIIYILLLLCIKFSHSIKYFNGYGNYPFLGAILGSIVGIVGATYYFSEREVEIKLDPFNKTLYDYLVSKINVILIEMNYTNVSMNERGMLCFEYDYNEYEKRIGLNSGWIVKIEFEENQKKCYITGPRIPLKKILKNI